MPGPTARIALSGKRRTLQKSAAFQPRRRAARPDFEGASRFRHRGTRGKRPAASGRTKRMGRHRPQETPSDTFQRFMNSETKKSGFRPEREAGRKRSQAFASCAGSAVWPRKNCLPGRMRRKTLNRKLFDLSPKRSIRTRSRSFQQRLQLLHSFDRVDFGPQHMCGKGAAYSPLLCCNRRSAGIKVIG